jgi:phospholipase/carboxylesterase
MAWIRFSDGFRLDPIVEGLPEALVVLLHDFGASASALIPIAERWAAMVPTTSFVALDGIEQPDRPSSGLSPHAAPGPDVGDGAAVLDRAAPRLELLLDQQLRAYQLRPGRLVLAGFGYGGTLALHMLLRRGLHCAGILAFAAKPMPPLSQNFNADCKVRLIHSMKDHHLGGSSIGEAVALLVACGIDARGVLLAGSVPSDEAVRHGGAYLVELVANAQRGTRFYVDRESRDAQ